MAIEISQNEKIPKERRMEGEKESILLSVFCTWARSFIFEEISQIMSFSSTLFASLH